MDNHAHLCLYYEKIENLSKFMHRVNTSFAQYYNFLEKRVGYLFKDRFYSQEIMSRKQLYNTVAYIHNNPTKAHIVKELGDYKYSSYNNYINEKIERDIIILVFETDKYKEIFNYIHKNYDELEIMDIEKEDIKSVLEKFLIEKKINMNELKSNEEKLYEVIKILYLKTEIKNKEIVQIFGLNKNKVTKIKKQIFNEK